MDYLTFFGFQDAPFRLTPDPQFFFPSHTHQEALQTLLYSVRAGEGFIQITGDPGTGKTLLLRTMLKELGDDVQTALILNPNLSPQDLLRVILDDFAVTSHDQEIFTRPKDQLIRLFRDFLLLKAEEGCKTVIIVDEAQNLPLETIEELRLLSNLETDKQKLLQIFLVGQRELEEKIDDASLRQLSQRITIRYCLRPFNRQETATYIDHRIKIAAPSNPVIIPPEIIDLIFNFSQGTPRLINIICERTFMAAYIDGQRQICKSHYDNATLSIRGEHANTNQNKKKKGTFSLLHGLLIVLLLVTITSTYIFFKNPQIWKYFLPTTSTAIKTRTTPAQVSTKSNQTLTTDNKVPAQPVPTQPQNEDREPTVKLSTTKTLPLSPTLPLSLIAFPPKSPLLVARAGELQADHWLKEENDSTPAITNQLPLPTGLRSGLLVVGLNKKKPFLFNPFNFLYGKQLKLPGSWNKFFSESEYKVVPLIILPDSATTSSEITIVKDSDSQTETQISRTINQWAAAWRKQDLATLMSFYGPVMTIYEPDTLIPLTLKKTKLKKIKEKLFQKTDSLSLDLSKPLCLIDPLNPNLAMAFFFQDYQSNKYQDKGYKALFLSRTKQAEVPDKWLISAKFFIPVE